ncbi:hypothetical protein QTQ03_21450 [Micromonospora sp. WMMA1363]|uniref:hypothetical protein n=1 Tax=Micromonospora sp. WMMA1363 TaxID=3053985 RepID=UPI00259CD5E3|nr:hypothetical protein [Micromonospora sp. WMMA1363]MDM4722026.1 hypothetical protein [Micromonospora sp. WMMA1363]
MSTAEGGPVAGGPTEDAPRSSLRAAARDRRVWAILAVVAVLLVCCCSAAAGSLLALSAGLFSAN